ncbi:MAG: FAD-dependent oxidoreductase [Terriglobales bacterium]|jgi:monomeric sarcosine oxidase
MAERFDFAVIGAGVFGSWTAHFLRDSGSVILLDAHGPANSRASSNGESRIIRMGYGGDPLYTGMAKRALPLWKQLSDRVRKRLFHRTGVLWLAMGPETYTPRVLASLEDAGVVTERLSQDDLHQRFPQIAGDDINWALLEPESGVLLARQAVQALVEELIDAGVAYRHEGVLAPAGTGRLHSVRTLSGTTVEAREFIFACGPWLGHIFPELLRARLFITRQEVFFFGVPAGTDVFSPPAMPVWICMGEQAYGFPDMEGRGFKLAIDRHGPEFDPEDGVRIVTPEGLHAAREALGRRFPQLRGAPVLDSRVCQYENTSSGNFLIDRHPGFDNVWVVGGGSGHGFKHGPVVGEYVSNLILKGGPQEQRFSLVGKMTTQNREVF